MLSSQAQPFQPCLNSDEQAQLRQSLWPGWNHKEYADFTMNQADLGSTVMNYPMHPHYYSPHAWDGLHRGPHLDAFDRALVLGQDTPWRGLESMGPEPAAIPMPEIGKASRLQYSEVDGTQTPQRPLAKHGIPHSASTSTKSAESENTCETPPSEPSMPNEAGSDPDLKRNEDRLYYAQHCTVLQLCEEVLAEPKEAETCKDSTKKSSNMRPCKGKRERYRKLLGKLVEKAQADPVNFDFDSITLPPSIASNHLVRNKLRERVVHHAERLAQKSDPACKGKLASERQDADVIDILGIAL